MTAVGFSGSRSKYFTGMACARALNSYASVEVPILLAKVFTNGVSLNAVPELRV